MTDVYGVSTSAISTTAKAVSLLRRSSSSSGASSATLPDSLKSSSGGSHRSVVSAGNVSAFLSAAQYIGNNIIGMLRSIRTAVSVADSSQSYTYANILAASSTRVSVGNISSDVNRTLERVQELVDNSGLGSANILSSTSFDLTLKTSAYGGKIDVTPQPLDLQGLNLENIDLHSDAGIKDALARIDLAISLAEQRVYSIQQLDNALNGTTASSSALRNVSATGQSELRGVLVNLFA